MGARINSSALSAVLIALAACSLFTMLSLYQMNYIVQGDLYNYGLQFSYRWAMPYWIFSGIVFGLSWMSIFLSIVVTLYILRKSRKHARAYENSQGKKAESEEQHPQQKIQRKLNEFLEFRSYNPTESKVEPEAMSAEDSSKEELIETKAQEA